MITSEAIALAEEAVKKRAEKTAYQLTDNIETQPVQYRLYTIYKKSIILGARYMQEELMKLTGKEK